MFCNASSKLLADTLPHVSEGQGGRVSIDPQRVASNLRDRPDLVRKWFHLIGEYAAYGGPPDGSGAWAVSSEKFGTRMLLLYAMEWFAIAHEYGHQVGQHGQSASSEQSQGAMNQELEADVFARAVSMRLGSERDPQNLYAMSGVGAVALLGMLELVQRARAILDTGLDELPSLGTHPVLEKRIEAIASLDQHAPEDYQHAFVDMRMCFLAIAKNLWPVLRPGYFMLHEKGLRPQSTSDEFQQWSRRLV
jgi:hypothetical protein